MKYNSKLQMIRPFETFREMSFPRILRQSAQLYRVNFSKLIGIVLAIKGPYLAFVYIISRLIFISYLPEEDTMYWDTVNMLSVAKFFELLWVDPVVISAMTSALSLCLLGKDVKVSEAFRYVLGRLLPLAGTVFLTGLVISSGFIIGLILLNLVPQVAGVMFMLSPFLSCILWVRYAFVPQTVAIEGEGGIDAMKRSGYLGSGYFWKIFSLLVPVLIAELLIASVVSYSAGKMLFFLGQRASPLGEGAFNVIVLLLEPFRMTIFPLLYYDLRIRKEGFDLEIMAKELEIG